MFFYVCVCVKMGKRWVIYCNIREEGTRSWKEKMIWQQEKKSKV